MIFCNNIKRGRASVFSDDNGMRYVLPVLWMTSCFHVMGHVARSVGNIDVGAVLQQAVINFQRIRQGKPRCLTLSSYIMAANCAPEQVRYLRLPC